MFTVDSIRAEIADSFENIAELTGKTHISVRWESVPAVARVGMCLEHYNWEVRMAALERLLAFEASHSDELALEFDIIPLDAVRDEEFAEA